MNLQHLSTNTPASEVSSKDFDDGSYSADLEAKGLDDILRNSPAAKLLGLKGESLPEEDLSVPNPDEASAEEAQEETDAESETALQNMKPKQIIATNGNPQTAVSSMTPDAISAGTVPILEMLQIHKEQATGKNFLTSLTMLFLSKILVGKF